GTLLFEEVDEMGPRLQELLLRVLEQADVRIISATYRDLLQRTADLAFSVDLYYRVNVTHLQIPPLRERREDISFLMTSHLKMLSEQLRLPLCELHPSALEKLEGYGWPGNVRELRHVAEILAVMHAGRMVTVDQLPETLGRLRTIQRARRLNG